MLKVLEEIFKKATIEINEQGDRIPLHSHTSLEQGIFLQQMFEEVKPNNSLEVGFAYGVSTLFILEKHRENNSSDKCHIVLEPDSYWGNAAVHNINKEQLLKYLDIKRDYSDKILPSLYQEGHRIQYAYIDTTKRFDVVMQDFYFVDKIMDVGGIIILDDCGGGWPGIQRVARYINTVPHYQLFAKHKKNKKRFKRRMGESILAHILKSLPFKEKIFPTLNFATDGKLGLDYACIAFKKIGTDERNWDWDKTF